MNIRNLRLTLCASLALSAAACIGTSDTSGSSHDEDSPDSAHANGDEANDTPAPAAHHDDTGVPTPSAPMDVAPPAAHGDGSVQSDKPGCLTFWTAEDGSGSLAEGSLQEATTAPRVVFLNRNGGTYTPGRNDSSRNTSSIPKRTVQVRAWAEGTESDWQKIVSCVKSEFASYNVSISDQEPTGGNYIEAVVGDGPQALDLDQGVGGISPFTCGVIEKSIVYIFSKVMGGVRTQCEGIAHEIGHSLGLEHEYFCQDPMTYLHGCGNKTFQDSSQACGTYNAVACECGKPTQNTVQKLLANVGPANTQNPPPNNPPPTGDAAPKVSVVSPANGATVPGNTDLSVVVQASDDKQLADVRLYWEFQGTRMLSCANAQDPVRCDVNGDQVTFTFPVGTGPRAFTAEAVDSANQTTKSARVTLTLSDDATADQPPTVAVTAPTEGSALTRGGKVSIRATATDDSAVRQVLLSWQSPTGAQTFRLDNLGGGTFGVDLTISANAAPGARSLTVTATDDAGQTATSTTVNVQVQ